MKAQAIRLHPEDNVATALVALSLGDEVAVGGDGDTLTLTVREDIPFGHKVALTPIAAGEPIRKYGEVIGVAIQAIGTGHLVHVHNVDGQRGRAAIG